MSFFLMNKVFSCFVLSLVFILAPAGVYAQRQIPGQWSLSLGAGLVPAKEIGRFAVSVSFDKMQRYSKMICRLNGGFDLCDYHSAGYTVLNPETGDVAHDAYGKPLKQEVDIPVVNHDLYASWGYMVAALRSRTRAVSLWVGVTADAGARIRSYMPSEGKDASAGYGSLLPRAGMLMGFTPSVEFEVFPASKFSMSAFFHPHFLWATRSAEYSSDGPEKIMHPELGIRLNWYFFIDK